MSTLKLKGSTSGYVELTAPATAGDNTITLPTTAGSVVVADGSGNVNVSGIITATSLNTTGNVNVGTGVTIYGSAGIVSATSFYGDASGLTNVPAGSSVTGNFTITNGNVVVSDGYGIDFSATSGTGTSELLDDYEEGTWTPSTYSTTLSIGAANYVKVGRMCTAYCYLTGVTSWTAATSNPFWIFDFPFQPDGGGYSAVGSVALHGMATSQSGTLSAVMDANNNRCRIQNNPTNGSVDFIDLAEMGATSWTCTVSITYRTTV